MKIRERRQTKSATSQRLSLKVWKRRKHFYSEQQCFPQNVLLGLSLRLLAILPVFFAENLEFFCSNSETHLKKHFFVRENFSSVKTILSAQRKLFRKTFQKIFAKVRTWQNGSSNIRNCDEIWTPGYVIFSLGKAAKSFLGNFPEFFAQNLKRTKNCFFFTKLFLFQKVPFLPNFLPKI